LAFEINVATGPFLELRSDANDFAHELIEAIVAFAEIDAFLLGTLPTLFPQ
jgi:hypothetical protein